MNYSRSTGKRKGTTIAAVMIAILMMVAAVIALTRDGGKAGTWDSVHPMANANVSWEQTFYGGRNGK